MIKTNYSSKKGFAVAGFVGLLSLALMLGVVGLTAYSALGKPTSNDTQASQRTIIDQDLGLTMPVKTSSEVDLVWTKPKNLDANATYTVLIRDVNGKPVEGARETLLNPTAKSKNFTNLNLTDGQYSAILRYIPQDTDKEVLRDTKDFIIGAKGKDEVVCPKNVFFSNSPKNRSGNYQLSKELAIDRAMPGETVVMYSWKPTNNSTAMAANLQTKLTINGINIENVDSDYDCKFLSTGFYCSDDSGAARYKISKKTKSDASITLNYSIKYPDNTKMEPFSCGPYVLQIGLPQIPPP